MQKKWWHSSTVYQIYPRSFCDSNGDGIGDLNGVFSKLDYLKNLGVEILWLSPVYRSPMDDNGYDISSYTEIDPVFGTMDDMDNLLAGAKARDLKIVMDLVVNHTSDEHPWFLQAKADPKSLYRDYYVWRKPVNGGEPSAVQSIFGGSAWEYDELSGEYYLHMFSKKQPDLNWGNPQVRREVHRIMRFWINKGVAGFRMDVIDMIGKDVDAGQFSNTENTHRYLQEMHAAELEGNNLFTVGETSGATIERAKLFSDPKRRELDTVFQFEVVSLDQQAGKTKWDLKPLSLKELRQTIGKWQNDLGEEGWNSLYWNNHDQPRALSRWGDDGEYHVQSAKMMATLLHFLGGTPYVYQGEEIGMTNAYFTSIQQYRDIETLNLYKERIAQGYSEKEILHSLAVKGRDNARTPFRWDNTSGGGFTSGTPWIEFAQTSAEINAASQVDDPDSIYQYYKKCIEYRKTSDTVVYGEYIPVMEQSEDIFAYMRVYGSERLLVICNFTGGTPEFTLDAPHKAEGCSVLLSNDPEIPKDFTRFTMKPYQAIVVRMPV